MSRSRRLPWLLLPIALTAVGFTLAKTPTRTMSVGVSVYPPSTGLPDTSIRVKSTTGNQVTFKVTNSGDIDAQYSATCAQTGTVSAITSCPTIGLIAQGAFKNVTVTFTTGATTGAGTVTITVTSTTPAGASGTGKWNETVVSSAAQVTPDGATAPNRIVNTGGYSETFTVKNRSTAQVTFTLTCNGSSNVTCTGVTPTSVQLNGGPQGGASTTATANYNVGAGGTGTLSVKATDAGGNDTGYYNIPVISYGVAVTPDSGEGNVHRPNVYGGVTFLVQNTGTQTDTFTFSCAATANITCDKDGFGVPNITPATAILAGNAQTTVDVGIKTAAEVGTGRVYLAAAGHHSTDQGWFWVPVQDVTWGVTPSNGWSNGAFTGTNYTAFFVLTDPDTAGHSYSLTCPTSTNVSCTIVSGTTQVFGFGPQSVNIQVSYSVAAGATGTGWIKLCVNSVDLCVGPYGKLSFTIWPNVGAHAVSVSSATTPTPVSFTNGYAQTYTVRNVGTGSDTYNFTCLSSANVTCGTVTPSSMVLASLQATDVTVAYNTGASGAGYVSLQASNANASNTKQVPFTVTPAPGYRIAVTPDAKSIGVLASTGASYPFTINNTGTLQNTYTIASSCTGAAIASGCTVSPSSATLAAGASTVATVSYTSGGASTTGVIKVTASQTNDAGVKDTGWINLATGTAQIPVAAVSTVNPGVSVERGLCITVALASAAAPCLPFGR